MVNTKVLLVFSYMEKGKVAWPRKDFNYKKRINELSEEFENRCPGIDFTVANVHSLEEGEDIIRKSEEYDGIVSYAMGCWTGVPEILARSGKPVVIANEKNCGSGEILFAYGPAKKDGFPVIGTSSSDLEDVVNLVKLFRVKKNLSGSKILVIAARRGKQISTDFSGQKFEDIDAQTERIRELFGIEVVGAGYDELNSLHIDAPDEEAEKLADKWISEAIRVIEPSRKEIIKSAKTYLALKELIKEKEADAVTIDCYPQIIKPNYGELPAYPCLALSQLNDDGVTAVCQADLESTVSQLLVRHLTKEFTGKARPGFVNDPVVDEHTGIVTYAHCSAPTRVFGPKESKNPYIIRSHAESREGASPQSLMPIGEVVTSIQIHYMGDSPVMTVHQGRTVGNEDSEEGCRTKLAARANTRKLFENWNVKGKTFRPSGWHRVTFYGDWKKQLKNVAALMGIDVFEEDKAATI